MNEKDSYLKLIKKQINFYSIIKIHNQELLELKKEFNEKILQKKIDAKNNILEKIKKIDTELDKLWIEWESFKSLFTDEEKQLIKRLRELIEENLKMEEEIIEFLEIKLLKTKDKKLQINQGKKLLNAYNSSKIKNPYFINKKG